MRMLNFSGLSVGGPGATGGKEYCSDSSKELKLIARLTLSPVVWNAEPE